ncbi:MAG: hypothetical protein ABIU76_15805 [Gemmatimonadaceae bacterium]
MSRAETVRHYLFERYPSRRFVPLALLLAGAGLLAVPGTEHLSTVAALHSGLRTSLVVYLIVLSLRVWDDLEDRERDARLHPERITVRVASVTPLRHLQWASAAVASVLIATGARPATRLLVLSLLVAVLGIWYRARASLAPSSVIVAHVVLLKYPVIAYLVAPGVVRGVSGLALAAPVLMTVYVLLCIHEGLDDPELRRSRVARGVLVAEAALMLPLLGLVIVSMLEPLRVLFFGRGSMP